MAITELDEEDIFHFARKLPIGGERDDYLRQACAGNEKLHARVLGLLNVHEQSGSFLAAPAAIIAVAGEPIHERPGAMLGRYKLLEQIGEGGFGVVFMAEQLEPVRRKVAVKIVKPGMDSKQVIARFEAERQALALMDHPNIARVLDGGQTPTGRPYFVMDLVKGLAITDFCDKEQFTLKQRLELFGAVCQAVQHAHQKGIIHRDLKPSNVLVTLQDGTPLVKVIDFGIAKALSQQLTDKTLFTGSVHMLGTPSHMSPEQAAMSNQDIDTRSDVYSLGVLLYELLTGTTPFTCERLQQADYDEMRRIIREEEPPRPSTRMTTLGQAAATISTRREIVPRQLSQFLRGELDWIVMKALEKDRNRRYESASAFATDVQRYLCDESVQACPPTVWYRCEKFARRNRVTITLTAVVAVALLLVVAAVSGSVGWVVSAHAAREAALDQEVTRILDESVAHVEEFRWAEAVASIQRAERLLSAAGRRELPPRLEELRQDVKMAELLEEIYRQPVDDEFFLGRAQDARYAQAFKSYGVDVTVLPVSEAADQIGRRTIRSQLVLALGLWSHTRYRGGIGEVADIKRLADIAQAADTDPWRRRFREAAWKRDRETVTTLAATADIRRLEPGTLYLLGRILHDLGDGERALAHLRRAQQQHPGDFMLNDTLGWYCLNARPPQYGDAARFYSAALAIRPNNPYLICVLGRALEGKGSHSEAIVELSRAIDLKADYADAFLSRGNVYLNTGVNDRALVDFSRVIELVPTSVRAWRHRGEIYGRLNQWDSALADFSHALSLDRTDPASWHHRGNARMRLKDWAGALADFEQLLKLTPRDPMPWFIIACLHLQIGDVEGYRNLCGRMHDCFGTSKDVHEVGVLAHAWTLGPLAPADGARVRQLAQLRLELTSPDSAWRPLATHILGLAYYRTGQNENAITLLEPAVAESPDSDRSVLNCLVVAMAHQRLSHTTEARQWLAKARMSIEQEAHPVTGGSLALPGRHAWDSLCVQMLLRESEKALNAESFRK